VADSWRKHPDRLNAPETRGLDVSFGAFGLKAQTQSRVKSNQIEAARRVISRTLGKTGKIWIRIFPDKPVTKKAAEYRWVRVREIQITSSSMCVQVVFSLRLTEYQRLVAREALRKATAKLPLKAKFRDS
jgi:large subunit ribosomal protein L16